MDYTTIFSHLEALLTGSSGVYIIAAIGVFGIIGAHFMRMRPGNSERFSKPKSYRHMAIAPYVEDEFGEPTKTIMPSFSTDAK